MPLAPQQAGPISDEDREVFKFFGACSCYFEGCDKLRQRYSSERDVAPLHLHSDIVRTYSDLVRDALGFERKFEEVTLPVTNPLTITQEGGTTEISGQLSAEEAEPYKFFGEGPCFFEGCEELRKQYWKEYDAIEEDPNCTDCMKAPLTRVYLEKVMAILAQE